MGPAKAAELLYFGRKVIVNIYFSSQKSSIFIKKITKIGVLCVLLIR